MKKIPLIMLSALMCLCGCSNSTLQTNGRVSAGQSIKGNYTGFWEHTEYPDAYSVIVYEQKKDSIGFVVLADRLNSSGMVMQTASVRKEKVKFNQGEAHFSYRDSFGNSGLCYLKMSSNELTFSFGIIGGYQGNWCIDAANGSYKKTKELSELDWFDKNEYELVDFNKEIDYEYWGLGNAKPIENNKYMWYGRYYLAGKDLEYDKDTFFDIWEGGTVTQGHYGRTTEGQYYIYNSDKSDYDFRILLSFDNGEEFLLYGKFNIPKNDARRDQRSDITFYQYIVDSKKLNFYGRYLNQAYIGTESAYRFSHSE